MSVYRRMPAVFRVAHDRVLVRTIAGRSVELTGGAALVWAALDAPADVPELSRRLSEAGVDTGELGPALRSLERAALVHR